MSIQGANGARVPAPASTAPTTPSDRAPGEADPPGVIVHDPAFARNSLRVLGGLGLVGAAVAGFGFKSPGAAIGSAVVGAGLFGLSFAFGKKRADYLGGTTYPSVDQALAGATAFKHDVGVHKAKQKDPTAPAAFGLVSLERFDVDNDGPGSVDLGNQKITFEGMHTRDGDVYLPTDTGELTNRGVLPQRAIDIAKATSLTPDLEQQLHGAQLGTNSDHKTLTINTRISPDEGFGDIDTAERWAFEQSTDPAAVLTIGGKYHVFSVTADAAVDDELRARGRTVYPMSSVTLVASTASHSASGPGAQYGARQIVRENVDTWTADRAAELPGRRVALSRDGVIRVGAPVAEYASFAEAEQSLFDRGGEYLMVQLAGRIHVFAVDGRSAIDNRAASVLGPDTSVRLFRGAHSRGVVSRDVQRMAYTNVTTIPTSQASELVGTRMAGYAEPYVRLGTLHGIYPRAEEAQRAAHDTGTQQFIVQMADGYAVFNSAGGDATYAESASPIGPDSAIRVVDERLMHKPNGPSWSFAGRSVPFEPSEPLGHNLWIGPARSYLGAEGSRSSAINYIVNNSYFDSPMAVVEGDDGARHIYELGSSGGSSWDERLGDIDAAIDWDYDTKAYTVEHKPPYPYERWNEAWVEKVEEYREWATLRDETKGNTRTVNDSGWYVTSSEVDYWRTEQLRDQLRREYEAWFDRNYPGQDPYAESSHRSARAS